jgi:hypothetical protein
MEKITSIKVAGIGAFGAVVIGLIFALYSAQGWIIPIFLAILLLIVLYGLLLLSLGLLLLAGVNAIKQFAERRATSALWVTSEEPGLLDCSVDGKRAYNRLYKELIRLKTDINRFEKRTKDYNAQINHSISGKIIKKEVTKLKKANRVGKQINNNAIYIEKRTALFITLIKEIIRNYEVMIATLNPAQEDDLIKIKNLKKAFELFEQAGGGVISALKYYQSAADSMEKSNMTKNIRQSSKRLITALNNMISCFDDLQRESHRLYTQLDLKTRTGGFET